MNINDKLFGWRVYDVSPVPDIEATVYLMEHERSGARLCYLEREDDCKTFAITFGTPPTDDTGVFHILEHSVLGGSKKFPLKEPFTELLKSSLNTFLNAMTYNDKTAYPVSSRNDKDFYNLVDVYMDAVLHPTATECENIFRQEGWRYEIGDDGELGYNGVVYSEMRGAYSSPEELADAKLAKLLYPNGTYSRDSGGDPAAITDLTYEDFCLAHKTFYRPENAYIFLDGKPVLDEILPLLDSYLCEYEKGEFGIEITEGDPVNEEPLTVDYEIDAEEDGSDKTRIYLAYRSSRAEELTRINALSVLVDAIADSNDAPFKKEMLASGLLDNVYLSSNSGLKWNSLIVELRGVKDGKEDEVLRHYEKTIEKLTRDSSLTELIRASIDLCEFKTREADYGSYPKGIIYMGAVTDGWFYGIHPRELLASERVYGELRVLAEGSYYTDLLREVTSSPRATLILRPSKTLAKERAEALNERLSTVRAAMSEDDISELKRFSEQFDIWQSKPDTPEALLCLPTLKREDLATEPREIPTNVSELNGATVLTHPINTNGISYVEMYFDASDTPVCDIPALVLMGFVYPNLDTSLGSANDFRRRSKSELGSISLTNHASKRADEAKFYVLMQFSALDSKLDRAIPLAGEYLFDTVLDNPDAIRRKLVQLTSALSDRMASAGHSSAIMRSAAKYSSYEAIKELTVGYEFYKWIKRYSTAPDSEIEALIEKMKLLRDKIFTRARLTLAVTGRADDSLAKGCVALVKNEGTPSGACEVKPLPRLNEGIAVPSQVSYASLGTNISLAEGARRSGAWSTLATVLNYQILWEEVRVKGGAYGTGFLSRANSGTVAFYSYRDPSPVRATEIFRTAGRRIRTFLDTHPDLTRFVIGTVGGLDEVTTPAADGISATTLYLAGKTHRDVVRDRMEAISATDEDLYKITEILDRISEDATVTVVGPRELLSSMGLDRILEL